MKGYILRKGDMITAGSNVGIITKVTPRYIYYFMKGRIARVKKETVWDYHDTEEKVSISYGSHNRRRPQRKLRSLDLHGTQHADVEEKVKSFLNFVELPCKIITGKSDKMKSLVQEIVYEYGWDCRVLDPVNTGTLLVREK